MLPDHLAKMHHLLHRAPQEQQGEPVLRDHRAHKAQKETKDLQGLLV